MPAQCVCALACFSHCAYRFLICFTDESVRAIYLRANVCMYICMAGPLLETLTCILLSTSLTADPCLRTGCCLLAVFGVGSPAAGLTLSLSASPLECGSRQTGSLSLAKAVQVRWDARRKGRKRKPSQAVLRIGFLVDWEDHGQERQAGHARSRLFPPWHTHHRATNSV